MSLFPRLELSTLEGPDALAEVAQATALLFDVEPVELPLKAAIRSYSLGDMLFAATASSALRFSRDRSVIQRSGIDHLLIQLYQEGSFTSRVGSSDRSVTAGGIIMFDLSQPFTAEATSFVSLSLVVPRRLLSLEIRNRHLHGLVLPASTSSARMVASLLRALWAECETADSSNASDIVNFTVSAIAGLLRDTLHTEGGGREGTTGPSQSNLIDYIDLNLASRDLGPDTICAHLGLSRATLYRRFAHIGGIAQYIRNRRLEATFEYLSSMAGKRERLAVVAHRWGFPSEDTFARAFRARYGFNPIALRSGVAKRLPRKVVESTSDAEQFMEWFHSVGQSPTA